MIPWLPYRPNYYWVTFFTTFEASIIWFVSEISLRLKPKCQIKLVQFLQRTEDVNQRMALKYCKIPSSPTKPVLDWLVS